MKKLIIYIPKLSVGGMEKSLINMLKLSNLTKKYEIVLYVVYQTSLAYMEMIPKEVKVKLLCKGKWNLFSMGICFIKISLDMLRLRFNKSKYDISICYSHHHGILSKLARLSSTNNIIYVHSDLSKARTGRKLKKFLNGVKFSEFKKVVCVSEQAKTSLLSVAPYLKNRVYVINNYIDGKDIIKKSKEKIKNSNYNGTIFINIARHLEKAKKISRIIFASKKLLDEGYKFKVWLIGDGKDTPFYKDMIKSFALGDSVILLGKKENPFPYFKKSNVLILSSSFEGYGIVLDEARVLNIPFITTDVGEAKKIVRDGYGIICENSNEGVYQGMKKFLDKGFELKNKFDYKSFNNEVTKQLEDLLVNVIR